MIMIAFSILLFYFHIFLAYSPKQSTIQLVNLSEDTFIGLFLLLLVYEHVFGCRITSCCFFAASLHKRYVF